MPELGTYLPLHSQTLTTLTGEYMDEQPLHKDLLDISFAVELSRPLW